VSTLVNIPQNAVTFSERVRELCVEHGILYLNAAFKVQGWDDIIQISNSKNHKHIVMTTTCKIERTSDVDCD
jgi:hypothetical protein